jgi:type IV pilus assembly protein PilA
MNACRFEKPDGFSLTELLIVVAVILVITAIAVPNLIRAKIDANEAGAVQTVRQITTAELSYHSSYPTVGYAPNLASLGGPAAGCSPTPATACIVDTEISSGNKSGYQFLAGGFDPGAIGYNTQFVASSAPLLFNRTGLRNFCIATDDGSVRAQLGVAGGVPAPDIPTCLAYPLLN